MRLIITRPEPDASRTAEALRALAHEALIVPLLTIIYDDKVTYADLKPQALLITSANGLRAFANNDPRRDIPVFCVGSASAAEAKVHGFSCVRAAEGDVASLTALVATLNPQEGLLLHIAGTVVSGKLAESLSDLGFQVVRRVAYQAKAVSALPPLLSDILSSQKVQDWDGIVFFSARTAAHFVDLVQSAGLGTSCHRLRAYCLSKPVEKALAPLHFRATYVAEEHTQDSLLACLERD